MVKSRTQIQNDSDNKRGVIAKSFKLPIETINLIDRLSLEQHKPKNQIIVEAIALLSNLNQD